ncbi:ATP-binding cassette domain-containing protein [Streptomyces sp. SM14]|uniref:ATP-binding cassette domain-containing protein n=1 Tax=Streptomyces sp. SM14 TaxID=1736045 RepID=UPI000CD59F70|nr:ATP-binding cassette domain-containing protein [Streptomyces sp. SM14]
MPSPPEPAAAHADIRSATPTAPATGTGHAVHVRALRKTYGDKAALDGLDLTVPRGTVHAVLGPNGAGKTTAVRVLTTLLRPDSGTAEVAGHDVTTHPDDVRHRIGLVGQHAALDEELSGRQNLTLFGRLHHLGRAGSRRRADELLARFDLADTGDKAIRHYSGGMRRRLDLAASLIVRPEVLFLDEPTTGLDPRGRAEVWSAVRSLAGDGTTVLLTTQYLEEADQLADRVSLLDHGRRVAEGTADELKRRIGADRVEVVLADAGQVDAAARLVAAAVGAGAVGAGAVGACAGEAGTGTADALVVDRERRTVSAPVTDRMAALGAVLRVAGDAGIVIEDIALRRPTLDEVFLALTGRAPARVQSPEAAA